jgi:uncharacterized damage-inducible protein DinB
MEEPMNIPETYDYLVRARRDLWAVLEAVPDEVLSRPLLPGTRFQCIKDHLFHIAVVEDGWIHCTVLGDQPVLETIPALKDSGDSPDCASFALDLLLNYWRAVEQSTLGYVAALTDDELKRVVQDSPTDWFAVGGVLWHVMTHEMRHTAQIAVLLRMQGVKPPALDLLFYLPAAVPSTSGSK